jgi:hypothetical protein
MRGRGFMLMLLRRAVSYFLTERAGDGAGDVMD